MQTHMCYLMYAHCNYEDKNGREKHIMHCHEKHSVFLNDFQLLLFMLTLSIKYI